jgi:pimeloyl-ACP methyl ester carboxylesterase
MVKSLRWMSGLRLKALNGSFLFLAAALWIATLSEGALGQEVAVTILDPVPELLAGDAVTAKPDDLAQNGRAVKGVSADGVAQVVLRIAGNKTKVGDRFILTLLNGQGAASKQLDEDGALEEVGKTDFNRNMITTRAVQTKAGIFAFALYRAPKDFPRAGGADNNAAQRSVTINVVFSNALPAVKQPIAIIRPVVILVHGLWGNPDGWKEFAPLVGKPADPRFSVQRASYDQPFDLVRSTPQYKDLKLISSNSLGLEFNAKIVISEAINFIKQFKNGDNAIKMPVAAVQADIVAHSMGGVVTLTMPLLAEFFSSQTFSKGLVHKLITIGTPHLGSPLAAALLDDKNTCVRGVFGINKFPAFDNVTIQKKNGGQQAVSGAVTDLRGDGDGGGLSLALASIKAGGKPLPTALVGGVSTQDNLATLDKSRMFFGEETNGALVIRNTLCKKEAGMQDTLAGRITPAGWPAVFNGKDHDSIVPLTSQLDAKQKNVAQLPGVIHTDLRAVGFTGPCELSPCGKAESGIPMQVVNLLNISVTNSDVFLSVP